MRMPKEAAARRRICGGGLRRSLAALALCGDGMAMPRAYGRTDTNERKMIVDGAAMVYYTVSERFSAEKAGNGALMC